MPCDPAAQRASLRVAADRHDLEWDEQAVAHCLARFCADLDRGWIGGCTANLWSYYLASFRQLHGRRPTTKYNRKE